MKLQVPFVQLPLRFDSGRLAEEVLAFDASAWRPHPQRLQDNFALPLITAGGDPESEAVVGAMRPTPHLASCPYLIQILSRIGAVWGRVRLMKLAGDAEVSPHADISYYWRDRVRMHIPIITQPSVRFICDGAEVNMAAGECWILDNWREHQVINDHQDARIHLVADTVGSVAFWDMFNRGRVPGREPTVWQAQSVSADAGTSPTLRLESVNMPIVMTPWELHEHIFFLLGETRPHPMLAAVGQVAMRFVTHWRVTWAQYGEEPRGWPTYRSALDGFERQMERDAQALQLANNAMFLKALRAVVLSAALRDRAHRRAGISATDHIPA